MEPFWDEMIEDVRSGQDDPHHDEELDLNMCSAYILLLLTTEEDTLLTDFSCLLGSQHVALCRYLIKK
jgi:hypothetical protein